MKNTVITFIIFAFSLILFGQNDSKIEQCKNWRIFPLLYNNTVSDSTLVGYWENYWYYRSGDTTKLIPDTLAIKLCLNPSLSILTDVDLPEAKYKVISTLQFKYGDHDDSYNAINPKISDTIVLLNEIVDLKLIHEQFRNSNSFGYEFSPKHIPIKALLLDLNINLDIVPWDFKKGKPYALNQIIITSSFYDLNSDLKCMSEFIFPISGAYNNENAGRWEY
ncbi:MAG: hypothetical protein GX259_01545 [Bacteroidales bacterium]|jgi:hypothetical protein|nr:hypothetical protein [Bacteroidales bacterium]